MIVFYAELAMCQCPVTYNSSIAVGQLEILILSAALAPDSWMPISF